MHWGSVVMNRFLRAFCQHLLSFAVLWVMVTPAGATITTYFSAGTGCGGGSSTNFVAGVNSSLIKVSLCANTSVEGLCGASVYPKLSLGSQSGKFSVENSVLSSGITDPSLVVSYPIPITNPTTLTANFGGSRPSASPNAPPAGNGQVLVTFDISSQASATDATYVIELDSFSSIDTTTPGTSCFAAPVTDSISATFTLVRVAPPTFTSATLTTFTVGSAGSFNVTATGTPNPAITHSSGLLPAGVSFAPGTLTGVLSGTPTVGTGAVGTYNLVFTGTNAGGATPQSFTLTVQKANQTITFGTLADRNQSVMPFAVTATAPGGTVSFASQTTGVCTTTGTNGATVTLIAGGTCTIRASQSGNADYNGAPDVDQSFTVTDDVPPNTTITAGPSGSVNSSSASFSFTSNEPGSTFECRIDGGSYSSCTSPQMYTGLADGMHTFDVHAIDAATNVAATPASRTWTVDTVAPDTTITSQPANPTNSTTATFNFNATETSTFQCRILPAAFGACSGSGTHTVEFHPELTHFL